MWVSGFYEGEGCLHQNKSKWFIQIGSTDLDVLQSVERYLGMGSICGPYDNSRHDESKAHYKPMYHFRLCGVKRVYAVCAAMYQFLGSRRKSKIEEFFSYYKNHKAQKHERGADGKFVRSAA